ncbi:rod shape-determining protein MreD [Dellaglioa sp. BT-FLS60]
MINKNKQYIFPVGLIISFFLDGTIQFAFSAQLESQTTIMVSHLLLLWLIMGVFYSDNKHLELWAFGIGWAFDSYYAGILGIYMILLPLIVYLTKIAYQYFEPSFIVLLLIYFIDLTVLEVSYYSINEMIGFANESVTTFISTSFGPTLAFNLVLFVILYYPISKLMNSGNRYN